MTKKRIKHRTRLLRKSTPNVLENLFEMQNRICDLCGHPIQGLFVAALDHSIPVDHFAKGNLSIKEAIQQCHNLKNLRATHSHCNHVKRNKTREEWFALGLDKSIEKPLILTEEEILKLKYRLSAGIRAAAFTKEERIKNGKIGGHKNVISGHISALGKLYGPISGCKAAENGLLARICSLGGQANIKSGFIQALGRKQGRKNVESGQLESISMLGAYAAGRKAVESGRIQILGHKYGPIRGKIQGLKNVETGHIQALGRKQIQIVNHERWHVARNIKNPNCRLCINGE